MMRRSTFKNEYDDPEAEEVEKYKKLKASPDFRGPTDTRYCTDIFCMGIIIAMWLSMTVVGLNAVINGDYRLVLHPLDYDGNICGTDVRTRNGNTVKTRIVNFTDLSFNTDAIKNITDKLQNRNYNVVDEDDGSTNVTILSNQNDENAIAAEEDGEGGRDMTDYPYLLFVNSYGGGVCVKECPKLKNATKDGLTDMRTLVTYGGIFQPSDGQGSELPSDFVEVADYSNSTDALFCTDNSCYIANSTSASWGSIGIDRGFGYAYYLADTKPLLNYCLITAEAQTAIKEHIGAGEDVPMDFTLNAYEFQKTLASDLWTARQYILVFGLGISFTVSMIYILLLRLPVLLNLVIWGSMFATIALFAFLGYYATGKAAEFQLNQEQLDINTPIVGTTIENEDTVKWMYIGGYVMYAIAVILFILMICLRKSIQLAIACVKEAGRAIHTMPSLFLVPVIQAIGFAIFVVIWIVYALYLASMGHVAVTDIPIDLDTGAEIAIRRYILDDESQYQGWYLLFCFYWTSNFIIAVGHMVISMSVARWYFCTEKRRMLGCGTITVFKSFMVTLFYHTGTCAFGSLLIAICQLIRSILVRIQKKAQESGSKFAQAILCCLQCCMMCLEKVLKFINKNAYIQCAIFGTNFCTSSRQSFFLVMRNIARISSLTYVASSVLIIGKLFISTLTTGLAYYYMVEDMSDALPLNFLRLEDNSPMQIYNISGPLIVIFIMAYSVSNMFMSVYDMSIYTVLHCFIADEEMFDEPKYAEKGLKRLVDRNSD